MEQIGQNVDLELIPPLDAASGMRSTHENSGRAVDAVYPETTHECDGRGEKKMNLFTRKRTLTQLARTCG